MKYPIRIKDLDSSIEFFDEILPLINESRKYLASHRKWCGEIYEGWLFTNIGYAISIFLYKINNLQSPEDNLVWVVVGDLPPMYLDTYNVISTREVVQNYISLVEEWVENAESGKSLEDCYPLDAEISKDSIDMINKRLSLLSNNILANIDDVKYEKAVENY